MYKLWLVSQNVQIMAIYEGGVEWAFSDGTTVNGEVVMLDGSA